MDGTAPAQPQSAEERPAHRATPPTSRTRQVLRHVANPTLLVGVVAPIVTTTWAVTPRT